MSPHQRSIAIVMWARWLGYVALIFFGLALAAILGWPRVMPHQLLTGVAGFFAFAWAGDWILRFIPHPDEASGEGGHLH